LITRQIAEGIVPIFLQYGYRMSKCAAHMAAVSMAAELRPAGVAVGIIHPGVVRTDMVKVSGSETDLLPEDSARGIINVLQGLNLDSSGNFWDYLGKKMPF
jgi:NAD(P)-dependent dehydrogenase (short-subunit alcohol dehydrogenase family)